MTEEEKQRVHERRTEREIYNTCGQDNAQRHQTNSRGVRPTHVLVNENM